MSANESNENVARHVSCVHMESVERFSKLPVVESTIETATNIYGKVKEYNSLTNWTLSTAESTATKVVEVGKPYVAPVVQKLGGPIKTVDGLLCSGLDYVEAKVPAVRLPPSEMYQSTKNCVNHTVDNTVQKARSVVEPAVQTAKNVVEPLVQPAVDKAKELLHYTDKATASSSSTTTDKQESENAECDDNKKEH